MAVGAGSERGEVLPGGSLHIVMVTTITTIIISPPRAPWSHNCPGLPSLLPSKHSSFFPFLPSVGSSGCLLLHAGKINVRLALSGAIQRFLGHSERWG